MSYKLFLDDERYPATEDFVVARSYEYFVFCIEHYGIPSFISFDHDLGEEKTGYDCAKYLVNYIMDHYPDSGAPKFDYYVHSQNPVGVKNIYNYLEKFQHMYSNGTI